MVEKIVAYRGHVGGMIIVGSTALSYHYHIYIDLYIAAATTTVLFLYTTEDRTIII